MPMPSPGQPWPAMASHGRPWPTMASHGWSWYAMAGNGRPWSAIAGHGTTPGLVVNSLFNSSEHAILCRSEDLGSRISIGLGCLQIVVASPCGFPWWVLLTPSLRQPYARAREIAPKLFQKIRSTWTVARRDLARHGAA